MGSGSTGIGAILEGFDFIGIEMDEEYLKIAETRIKVWKKSVGKPKKYRVYTMMLSRKKLLTSSNESRKYRSGTHQPTSMTGDFSSNTNIGVLPTYGYASEIVAHVEYEILIHLLMRLTYKTWKK